MVYFHILQQFRQSLYTYNLYDADGDPTTTYNEWNNDEAITEMHRTVEFPDHFPLSHVKQVLKCALNKRTKLFYSQ